MKPVLGPFGEGLYDAVLPLQYAETDAQVDYALAKFVYAMATFMEDLEAIIRDDPEAGTVGWSSVVDLNRAPRAFLPWLAQFIGVRLTDMSLTDDQLRARILSTDGFRRGTVASMIGAAQQYLTGTKTVQFIERSSDACPSDPAYGLTVITYISETPDEDKVRAALISQKPAGIVLDYRRIPAWTYQGVYTYGATYNVVRAGFPTYEGVLEDDPTL